MIKVKKYILFDTTISHRNKGKLGKRLSFSKTLILLMAIFVHFPVFGKFFFNSREWQEAKKIFSGHTNNER